MCVYPLTKKHQNRAFQLSDEPSGTFSKAPARPCKKPAGGARGMLATDQGKGLQGRDLQVFCTGHLGEGKTRYKSKSETGPAGEGA